MDVANNALSKSGGNFEIKSSGSDVNFGQYFGVVSIYFKSRSSNGAASGAVRLSNTDKIGFRNNNNNADLLLGVSSLDRLQFQAVNVPTVSSTDTLTNKSISATSNTITGLTKSDVGLSNVDNTSDANKPVSTAQASADAAVQAFAIQRSNHTGTQSAATITGLAAVATSGSKADVGLSNVDNTSDASKNAASVTLTNKTITNPVFNSYTDYSMVVAQSAPVSGVRVYGKADGKLYKIDSASGIESAIGGGLAPEAKSANFTAVAGKHYLVDTSAGAITATLPAGSSEAAIKFTDASETWDVNTLTITPAAGQIIDGLAANETLVCDVERGWVELSWNGSKWVLGSLASTQVAVASATQAGIVSTGAQTFAGAKTFNSDITSTLGLISLGGNIESGTGRAADGAAFLDLTSQSGVVDYNARIIRNSGANGSLDIIQTGTGSLTFFTSGSGNERFRITSGGRPIFGGFAEDTGQSAGTVTASGYRGRAGTSGAFSNVFNTHWSGSAAQLWVDTTNLGTITTTSDYRIKKDIETQTVSGLDRIIQLRPVTYKQADYGTLFKSSDDVKEGFIAHELQEVIPSAVSGLKDDPNQIQTLKLDALCAVMVKAIQEQQYLIESLKSRIETLEGASNG